MSDELRYILYHAAHTAADIQRVAFEKGPVELKKKYGNNGDDNCLDLVTRTDRACERVLRSFFSERLPDFNIFGEEYGAKDYNGNGKFITIDPVDCTWSFVHGLHGFGPVISVYVDGYCIGAVEYNAMRDIMYLGVEGGELERFGPPDPAPRDLFYFGFGSGNGVKQRIENVLHDHIPGANALSGDQDVLNRSRVFDGIWRGVDFKNVGFHDIAAAPLFGRLTGTKVTDIHGNPIEPVNAADEATRYNVKGTEEEKKKATYSKSLIMAKPFYHKRLLTAAQDLNRRNFQIGRLKELPEQAVQ